ncbi:MAG: carbohydrate kinase family protein [Lachnospiraceae bacterium]|nr:carbohydrate kinase family protein [Lachnospiraceae bacterium]
MHNWKDSAKRITTYFNKPNGKITLGIDGYIDEVWQIIASKKGKAEYIFLDKMRDFSDAIHDSGTGGFLTEMLPKRRSYGGFGCNTGKAVGNLGFDLTLIGTYGTDSIDPLFLEFSQQYKLFSVGNPGIAQVFEFTDGKIMLVHVAETSNLNWEQMIHALSYDTLKKIYSEADIVGLGYWSLLCNFDDIISKLYTHFLENGKCKRVFFDFSDFRKHDKETLFNTFHILGNLNKKIPMTLSVNEHEAKILYSYFGKDFEDGKPELAKIGIDYIRTKIGMDELVIHTPSFAAASSAKEGNAIVLQRFCKNPVITTGAGDNFNGGYLAASVRSKELNLSERLLIGNAATGSYIRTGKAPNTERLLTEIHEIGKEKYENCKWLPINGICQKKSIHTTRL